MLVLIHVAIAMSSLIVGGINLLFPSKNRLRANYVLIVLTFASGSLLVISERAHILQTCISGLIYLSVMTLASVATRHKLNKIKI